MAKKTVSARQDELASAGHRVGQIVGDWWETEVILPLLTDVAKSLELLVDNRTIARKCRGEKIVWSDSFGNWVDYDFVLELGGSDAALGIPVAFVESFWRRGARHSKDKARDDTNKLLPMRETYPTARFLAIAACGEFTEPAREYVRSRNVELFYVSKANITRAFESVGLDIDYPDNLDEQEKNSLAAQLERGFSSERRKEVAAVVRHLAGEASFAGFTNRVVGALTALPQEIRICAFQKSPPMIFKSIAEASRFLSDVAPVFKAGGDVTQFGYEVVYSDGTMFERTLPSLEKVREINAGLARFVDHVNKIAQATAQRTTLQPAIR